MIAWLKYFFLGFFNDKYTGEAPNRSFWNTVLAVVFAFVILCTGVFTGYVLSFKTHYENSKEFRAFISASLGDAELKMENGKLSSPKYVNDFLNLESGEKLQGYGLIIDTRPAAETFDDFSVMCYDGKENEITYEEYLALPESDKSGYTPRLLYSGKTLDVTAKQNEYKNYLNGSEAGRAALSALDSKKSKGELTETEYANGVYTEYIKLYYPSIAGVERYGQAPTLRTYYLGMVVSDFSDSFIMILNDLCVGSFKTDSGVQVEFEGYFSGIAEGAVDNLDTFINDAFAASSGYNYLLYFMNMFKFIPIALGAFLIIALLTFLICRYKVPALKTGYIGSLKIVCSYLLISSVITFIVSIALSFFSNKLIVYLMSMITFVVIVLLRVAVLIVKGIITEQKNSRQSKEP